jgi:hypothetical protein
MAMFEVPEPGAAMDVGVKLTVTPVGCPVANKATAELNPPEMATVTVDLPASPRTVTDAGDAEMVKSGGATPTPLRLTLGLAEETPSEPLTVSAPRRVPRAAGVKVTLKVHDVPPRTPAAPQVFACEKSPVIPMFEN